jgi:hypothetical protein
VETREVLIIIVGLLGVPSAILIPYGFHLMGMEIREMKGELIPFEVDPQKPIEVQIGGFHVHTTMDKLSEGFNLSRYVNLEGYNYPFRIELKDGRFLASVEVLNANGEVVARIVDNQWVVNENTVIARDRNYNAYAFEVIDSNLVPVIQVIFAPQNKMYLGGLFYTPTSSILFTPNVTIIGPSSDDISEHIQPIFRYPSEEYLGVMVDQPAPINRSIWFISVGVSLLILCSLLSSGLLIQEKRRRTKRKTQKTTRPRTQRTKRRKKKT